MDKKEWSYNLSYSLYSLYKESQFIFYLSKIAKARPDTDVPQVYGMVGNIVHNSVENFIKDDKFDYINYFYNEWNKKEIPSTTGLFGRKLNSNKYKDALENFIEIVKNLKLKHPQGKFTAEKYFLFKPEDLFGINVKGYIDLVIEDNKDVYLFDWKTDSAGDYEKHKSQRLFYSWMWWKYYNIIPKKCTWFYGRAKCEFSDSFTEDDILKFDDEIKSVLIEMSEKKKLSDYDLGEIDGIFNSYKKACLKEKVSREHESIITAYLNNNQLIFKKLPTKLINILDNKYSYFVDGYQWSELYKKRIWDGKRHKFKIKKAEFILPYPLVHDFERLLDDFNKYYNTSYELRIVDGRVEDIVNKKYNTKFIEPNILLRDYQVDAVNVMLDKKIGILFGGCGFGKTVVAGELIRRINKRTLFIINRKELVDQTAEVFESYLGVNIGRMYEGELVVDNQITVASIQTLYAILQRKDKTSQQLKLYLHNINALIFDECHGTSDGTWYGEISKYTTNLTYSIGLSGSPTRPSDTLEMNCLVGFVEFTKRTSELQAEGWLSHTKNYFITCNNIPTATNYADIYEEYIINNDTRNNMIIDIVNKYKAHKKILVITRRVAHGILLKDKIEKSFLITGSTKKEERKENFNKFKKENGWVLIGSSQIFSTGVDIPDLDIIIYVSGGKSENEVVQVLGRVMRKSKNKKYGYYIDFNDISAPYFDKASKSRMKGLENYENKCEIIEYKDLIIE